MFCWTCDENRYESYKHPVFKDFEGGTILGYDCEDCAERKWEQWQEALMEGAV